MHQRKLSGLRLLCSAIAVIGLSSILSSQTSTGPLITKLEPASGPVGTEVTIVGSGFGASQGSSTVTFNGAIATPRSWSETEIVVPVPENATTGPVVVTVNGVHSKGVRFVVIVEITAISPPEGCPGTVVAILGSGFGPTQGASTVTFDGVAATPTAWSATNIDVPVPAGATSGPLVVKVKGESASVPFIVISCQ
jgi:hypothetical protein